MLLAGVYSSEPPGHKGHPSFVPADRFACLRLKMRQQVNVGKQTHYNDLQDKLWVMSCCATRSLTNENLTVKENEVAVIVLL